MRNFIFILLVSLSLTSASAFVTSAHPPGVSIENAFYVGDSTDLIRGRIPRLVKANKDAEADQSKNELGELKAAGVTNFLIIKNQTRTEVQDEMDALKVLGYKVDGEDSDVLHVDYRWKEIDQDVACLQTAQILEHIRAIEAAPGKKLYFHCTAGIDRTGMVAGLHRLLVEPASTKKDIFKTELCERGYGDAEPRPPEVIEIIHNELTPIYLKFARAIIRDRQDHFLKGELKNICNPEFYKSTDTEADVKENLPHYKCQ